MKRYLDYDEDYPVYPGEDNLGFPASSYDMTGLIPSAPESDDEAQAYEEIYPYAPDDIQE